MKTNQLLSLCVNKTNLDILTTLHNNSHSKDELVKKINASMLDNCLKKLKNIDLIKQYEQKFLLTKKAEMILQKITLLRWLAKNNQYFQTHDFGDVPQHMTTRLDWMSKCELVQGTFPTTSRLKNTVENANEFIYCIFTHPPFLLADSLFEQISNGVELCLMFGKNSEIPKYNDLVKKLELYKLKQHKFKQKISENVQINIIASEKQACVMLPDIRGVTDMQNVIVGDDVDFIKWCHDFFDHKWENGEQIARIRD